MTQAEADAKCLAIGQEVVSMIGHVEAVSGNDAAYARRRFTFRDSEVFVFIVKNPALAEVFEAAARRLYDVVDVAPSIDNVPKA